MPPAQVRISLDSAVPADSTLTTRGGGGKPHQSLESVEGYPEPGRARPVTVTLPVGARGGDDASGREPSQELAAALDTNTVPEPPSDRLKRSFRKGEKVTRGARADADRTGAEEMPQNAEGQSSVAVSKGTLLGRGK